MSTSQKIQIMESHEWMGAEALRAFKHLLYTRSLDRAPVASCTDVEGMKGRPAEVLG